MSTAVVAVGAHPDDIELGAGATLARHAAAGDEVTMLVLTRGELGPGGVTTRVREAERAAARLGARLVWGPFVDGTVTPGRAVVKVIEDVLDQTGAELLYTHFPDDTHQDHRVAAQGSLGAGRDLLHVLFYESPTTRNFTPGIFVDASATIDVKLAALSAHVSQVRHTARVELDAVRALARVRGFAARVPYAEAFVAERVLWCPGAVRHATGQAAELPDGLTRY